VSIRILKVNNSSFSHTSSISIHNLYKTIYIIFLIWQYVMSSKFLQLCLGPNKCWVLAVHTQVWSVSSWFLLVPHDSKNIIIMTLWLADLYYISPDIILHVARSAKWLSLLILISLCIQHNLWNALIWRSSLYILWNVHSKKGKNNLIGVFHWKFSQEIWRQGEMKRKFYQCSYEISSKFVYFCC